MSKKKTVQEHFDFFTRDFKNNKKPQIKTKVTYLENGTKMISEYSLDIPEKLRIYQPYIVFIIFVKLKKFDFLGKWEKIAWQIPVEYKGEHLVFTHRKFGFKVITSGKSPKTIKLATEALEMIHKAIPFAEELIAPHIRNLIKKGSVSLDNEYSNIRNRYVFFREMAEKAFSIDKGNKFDWEKGTEPEKIKELYNTYLRDKNSGHYYVTAMLDSYFCLLEHLLVLLLPFIDRINISEIDVEDFISMNWKDKFKIIFSLSKNKQAQKIFKELNEIKDELRNPLTHGYFFKNGHSFLVQMENLGIIPMKLTKSERIFRYSFGRIKTYKFESICKCFDECDRFFETDKSTKYGLEYINTNLSIAFDSFTSDLYKAAMIDDETFDNFMHDMMRRQDDAANMDW